MASEKNFENRIKKLLKDKGAWHIKYWAGAEFTKSGIPDILACVGGSFVAIEVKAEKGTPSELQLYNLRKIEEAGGYALLLYPDQWDNFRDFIAVLSDGETGMADDIYWKCKGWGNGFKWGNKNA